MSKWEYGEAYKRHTIEPGKIVTFEDGSKLQVHDIFDPLPDFMREADLIFVDPPWNLGNLNSFYTKADRQDHQDSFERFYKRLFVCIEEINPRTCYIEVGKQYLPEFVTEARKLYKQVTFYNSSYYHKRDNICYVIRASNNRKKVPLEYMDEEDIIAWICANEDYECIGDLCMGLGLVGLNAHKNGKRFVGTELNPKRLAVLLEKISDGGMTYAKH